MKESKTLSVLNLAENLLTDKIMSALAQSLVRLSCRFIAHATEFRLPEYIHVSFIALVF
jgi:hypothetical protein